MPTLPRPRRGRADGHAQLAGCPRPATAVLTGTVGGAPWGQSSQLQWGLCRLKIQLPTEFSELLSRPTPAPRLTPLCVRRDVQSVAFHNLYLSSTRCQALRPRLLSAVEVLSSARMPPLCGANTEQRRIGNRRLLARCHPDSRGVS